MKIIGIFLIITITGLLNAAFGDDLAESFLSLSPDAASQSIGGSNAAYSIGAADIFTNPALMPLNKRKSVQFSNMINSRSYHFSSISFVMSLTNRNFIGIGYKGQLKQEAPQSGIDNITLRWIEPSQHAVYLSMARRFNAVSVGATIQYYQLRFNRSNITISDKILLLNLGGYYNLGKDVRFGITIKTPFWTERTPREHKVAGKLAIGLLWQPAIDRQSPLEIVLGVDQQNGTSPKLHGGLIITPLQQTSFGSNIRFRAGIGELGFNLLSSQIQSAGVVEVAPFYTIGAGFGFDTTENRGIDLDYCYQIKEYISNQHIITTRIRF